MSVKHLANKYYQVFCFIILLIKLTPKSSILLETSLLFIAIKISIQGLKLSFNPFIHEHCWIKEYILGICKLKYDSVTKSNCIENSIPNRLKVVHPQSSFHQMWWKTWLESNLSLSEPLWFLSCLFSVLRILKKILLYQVNLKENLVNHQGSTMYHLHTVLSCVLCYLSQ